MKQHELTTHYTADALEARDTAEEPLIFRCEYVDGRYNVGDGVILTSSDGAVFIGHVCDDEAAENGRIYVELD